MTKAGDGSRSSTPLESSDDRSEATGAAPATPRAIRSFVLRQGRISPAQQRACEALLPRYGIPLDSEFDWPAIFGRTAPVVLEIGFGMGETTAAIAAAHPHVDFVGVEMHLPGVGALLRRLDDDRLDNVRLVRADAVDVVGRIARGSLAGVHVYFPDPWPKKRHHKRRLLQPPFVHELALRIATGGYLHVATDWAPYADEILAVLQNEPLLTNTSDGFAPRPVWRPLTKFERRGIARGHGVFDMLFKRRS